MTKTFDDDDEDLSFPVRQKTSPAPLGEVSDTDEEGEGGEGENPGELLLTPPWFLPEPGAWLYNPQKKIICHEEKNKKILLRDLKSPETIIKLLAALESQKDLDVDDLIIALQDASYDCYQISLPKLLTQFKGKQILWEDSDYLLRHNVNNI